jgi:hypothetical protein
MSSSDLEEKIRECLNRLLAPESTVQKIFHSLVQEVLEQTIGGKFKIQNVWRENSNLNFNSKKRKISEYVTFCRFMKRNFPNQKNLQSIWRSNHLRNQWKSAEMDVQRMQTVPIIPPPSIKLMFDKVIEELKQMQEDDPIDTLFNIQRKTFFMRPCSRTQERYSSSED